MDMPLPSHWLSNLGLTWANQKKGASIGQKRRANRGKKKDVFWKNGSEAFR